MSGVEILTSYEVSHISVWWLILVILAGSATIIGITYFAFERIKRKQLIYGLVGLVGVCSVIALGVFVDNFRVDNHMRYECLVNDTVSANELYENYEIIDKKDKIWILEEKTDG